ncbi:Dihydroxyacetone kinase [Sodalis praecaptivus]
MNTRNALVNDAIEGTIVGSRWQNLVQLDVDPFIRVVVRKEWQKDRVALISGGGSGHEPAHVGFVGKGMLTAAVCGDIFASPSVDAVLSAILAVTGEPGCLLIVKNYTGDRLNFGLAAEKAKRLGYRVELVMVDDDISLPDNKQQRGIAGTALIHKIAGYVAEQGLTLAEVTALAQKAIGATASIGVAMTGCNLPEEEGGAARIKDGHVELGLGIHGEPGAQTLPTVNSRELIQVMVDKLSAHLPAQGPVAALINNLGGVSSLEMSVLTKELVHSPLHDRLSYLIGPAPLVSALDMKGFSLSLLALDATLTTALLAEVETASWQPLTRQQAANPRQTTRVTPSVNARTGNIIDVVTEILLTLENELNRLDSLVGDGDTGTTFAAGAREIATLNREGQLPQDDPAALLTLIGDKLATIMGGSSGVLMSIFFTAAGQQVAEGQPLAQALETLAEGADLHHAADAARAGPTPPPLWIRRTPAGPPISIATTSPARVCDRESVC